MTKDKEDMVLKLLRNMYEFKDASLTWFKYLIEGLDEIGFKSTYNDLYIFVKGTYMIILYMDDCIIVSKNKRNANII